MLGESSVGQDGRHFSGVSGGEGRSQGQQEVGSIVERRAGARGPSGALPEGGRTARWECTAGAARGRDPWGGGPRGSPAPLPLCALGVPRPRARLAPDLPSHPCGLGLPLLRCSLGPAPGGLGEASKTVM